MKKDWAVTVIRLVKTENSDELMDHGKNQVSFIARLVKLLNRDAYLHEGLNYRSSIFYPPQAC